MDDRLELGRLVEHQAQRDAEALAQRARHQAGTGGGADQGERRQVDAHRARRRPFADDEVELEVLHCRVEDLLDRRHQAVDLVDEEHVARLQVGEQRGEIAGALNDRPGRQAVADAHLARDDLGQRRLAETGRTREENMVEGFAARACGQNKHPQILADLALPDEIVEGERSQRGFAEIVLAAGAVDDARIAHDAISLRPPRIRASRPASAPILREARATAPKASTRR